MNVHAKKQQKGFTIIEVILVLAIAALIFLMVFIALPALQKGQRDTQRRQDLAKVLTAVQNFQANSQGTVPSATANNGADLTTLLNNYLKSGNATFKDPNGTDYTLVKGPESTDANAQAGNGKIYYTNNAICGNGGSVTQGQPNNKVAVQMPLEAGGIACDSNN